MRLFSTWNEQTWIGGLGAVMAAGTFTSLGTSWALAIALAILFGWVVLPAVYVVALAHLLLPIVLEAPPEILWLISLELGCVLVLFGSATALTTDELAIHVLRFGGMALLLAGTIGVGFMISDVLWVPVAMLLCGFALTAYVLHRYERLQLGLLEESA